MPKDEKQKVFSKEHVVSQFINYIDKIINEYYKKIVIISSTEISIGLSCNNKL